MMHQRSKSLSLQFGMLGVVLTSLVANPRLHAQTQGFTPNPAITPGGRFHEPDPYDFSDHKGYVQIFDGKTLHGWDGDPQSWRVENGAIVGESTVDKPRNNTYIVYKDDQPQDFDLKLEIKVEKGGGSGIQYRSKVGLPWTRLRAGQPKPNLNWMMTGPQADFWYPVNPRSHIYTGQFYSENTDLGILAWRGQVAQSQPGTMDSRFLGNIGNRDALGGFIKINDWNEYEIIVRGGVFMHIINGQLMTAYIDDDPKSSNNQTGYIGLEMEGTPTKISVRNIWLKKLK